MFSLTGKIVVSVILVTLAIKPARWQDYSKILLYFYLINFTVAGATIALSSLLAGTGSVQFFPAIWIVVAVLAALAIGMFAGRYIKEHLLPGLLKFPVVLRFGKQHCTGHGFVDTGNALKDPLTSKPVIVAEYELIKPCLPPELQNLVEKAPRKPVRADHSQQLGQSPETYTVFLYWEKNGMLLGVRADEVVLNIGTKDIMHTNTVIGIYRERLNPQGSYQLLIPADMVEGWRNCHEIGGLLKSWQII